MPATLAALTVLIFLLPGFVTDKIITALTPQKSRSDARVAIDSLVWAFVDQVFYRVAANVWRASLELRVALSPHIRLGLGLAGSSPLPTFPMNLIADHPEAVLDGHVPSIIVLLAISLAVGLVWSLLSVQGVTFAILRFVRVTRATGRVDVWQDVLTRHKKDWLRVYLKDGTRVVGWADSFSDDGGQREIFLREAAIEEPIAPEDGVDQGSDDPIYSVTQLTGPGILLTEKVEILYIEVLPRGTATELHQHV